MCVYVCVRERERDKKRNSNGYVYAEFPCHGKISWKYFPECVQTCWTCTCCTLYFMKDILTAVGKIRHDLSFLSKVHIHFFDGSSAANLHRKYQNASNKPGGPFFPEMCIWYFLYFLCTAAGKDSCSSRFRSGLVSRLKIRYVLSGSPF